MKAIRVHEFGAPEVMKLETVPDPVAGPGQVVVRAHAVGVNPVETYIRSGNYAFKPPLPYTPGGDAAGVVASVGSDVIGLKNGDRVYTAGSISGTYAELALCKIDQVYPLPANVTFQQGAAVNIPYVTAYRALFHRAKAHAGQTVLVHGGSGGVGIAAVQWAVAAGMTVIGTAGTDRGRQLVREQGAAHVLDHKSPAHVDELMQLTAGHGVDVILEMLANVNLAKDLTVLARRNRRRHRQSRHDRNQPARSDAMRRPYRRRARRPTGGKRRSPRRHRRRTLRRYIAADCRQGIAVSPQRRGHIMKLWNPARTERLSWYRDAAVHAAAEPSAARRRRGCFPTT